MNILQFAFPKLLPGISLFSYDLFLFLKSNMKEKKRKGLFKALKTEFWQVLLWAFLSFKWNKPGIKKCPTLP